VVDLSERDHGRPPADHGVALGRTLVRPVDRDAGGSRVRPGIQEDSAIIVSVGENAADSADLLLVELREEEGGRHVRPYLALALVCA
jgi:hypothetical protein